MNEFASGIKTNTSFIVQNVTTSKRTIKIFNQKIPYNTQFDLLQIPGISIEDIKASLLKGVLADKLRLNQIVIIFSDLDNNSAQINFLQNNLAEIPYNKQLDWYIDPANGNDTNQGNTAANALKTHSEFIRRLRRTGISTGITVNILGDVAEDISTDLYLDTIDGNISFIFYRADPIPLYSGSVTSITNYNDATQQDGLLTDTALPVSWTASGLVGKIGIVTGGVRLGTRFIIAKDMGSKQARISSPNSAEFTASTGTLQIGDPFTIYNLVKFGSLVRVAAHGGYAGQIFFQYLEVGTVGSHSVECAIVPGSSFFDSCILNGLDAVGQGQLYNCRTFGGCRVQQGGDLFIYGGVNNGCKARYNGRLALHNVISQDAGLDFDVPPTGIVQVGNASTWYAMFDTTTGVTVGRSGVVDIQGRLWGKNVTGTGVVVQSDGTVIYNSARPIAILNTATNTSIGGTATAYGSLPFINTANHAKIIVSA